MKINYPIACIPGILLLHVMLTISVLTVKGQPVPQNKYGLPVVQTTAHYQQLVAADSNQALIDIAAYIPGIRTDIRYATADNFTHQVLYPYAAAYLRLPAARALKAVQEELNRQGLGLLIFDAYRPYSITEKMWEIVPDDRYAANPRNGSGHNRGVAVDLTLVKLQTGQPVAMPTGFDDFTEKAHHAYPVSDTMIAANRQLLRSVMEKHGFLPLTTEWWHYYLKTYKEYPLMDIPFSGI
ncbi:M15 family metallopeptidase [Chitinophaga rhizophila]|uniref:D-alanyl-D-alanine dipeptidase n=1 Tax=Chitinophaga rhizophila TaxID=2866212 RepID=A0ABS7G8J2_9BACT|nr:M15 family metallopeptidase [Chitinophaga rhizophila]MBW8683959.1 M15 family metallopeptidase [Chitinophaga rhizophila]